MCHKFFNFISCTRIIPSIIKRETERDDVTVNFGAHMLCRESVCGYLFNCYKSYYFIFIFLHLSSLLYLTRALFHFFYTTIYYIQNNATLDPATLTRVAYFAAALSSFTIAFK